MERVNDTVEGQSIEWQRINWWDGRDWIPLDTDPMYYACVIRDNTMYWMFKNGDGQIGFMYSPSDVEYDLSEIID